MFGSKYNHYAIRKHLRNLKSTPPQAPHQMQALKSTNPIMASGGGGGGAANANAVKAVGGYNQLRNKVMDMQDTSLNHVNQVASGLKKSKINIGL
jgi:hypothetical protein